MLGLAEGPPTEEIKAAHRRLIQRMHPDVGGSADLAARINRAKDVLLGADLAEPRRRGISRPGLSSVTLSNH